VSSPTPNRQYVSIQEPAKKLQAEVAKAVAERQAERATYTGNCFDCKDTGWQWEDYPCRHCDQGRQIAAEREKVAAQQRCRELIDKAGIPLRCKDFTFASYPTNNAARAIVAKAVGNWDFRQSLFLYGPYGIGKTGLMVAALRHVAIMYAEQHPGATMRFASAPQLFRDLRAGYADESYTRVLDTATSSSLLALDDLGAEKPTEWVKEQLYLIVNERYDSNRPIWITSNLTLDELEDRIGERVVSRLSEMCALLPLSGKNLRSR
jgi:DNA replication protein DnaC